MKFFKSVALAASLAVSAAAADAATYTINQAVDSTANGFGSSLFHTQTTRMNGHEIKRFDGAVGATTGAWSTDIIGDAATDNIYFTSDLVAGGKVSARGYVNQTARANGFGLTGAIRFLVSDAGDFDGVYNILFDDQTFVSNNGNAIANAFLGSYGPGGSGELGLWGDLGNYPDCKQSSSPFACVGLDLRLAVTEGGDFNIPPVPLPAAGWMLLAALGGLAASRRKSS